MSAPADHLLDGVEWKLLPAGESLSSEETGLHATHEGYIQIAGFRFKCYQLSDGSRVFDADSVEQFFGSAS